MYADDRGVLCQADDLDHKSGCCRGGDKHSCATCEARDRCCEQYEACVSCCLAPSSGAKARLGEVFRVPGKPASGSWKDEFELCSAVCRTHSASTSHENAYISPRHHCFSRLGKPLLSPPPPAGALDGVDAVLGAPGLSCDAACAQAKGGAKQCSQRHLPLLDACDRLRESVACEAGCVAEAPAAAAAPFYSTDEAPKADRPALCVTGPGGIAGGGGGGGEEAEGAYSCAAAKPNARRLCPCTAIPAGSDGAAAAAKAAAAAADAQREQDKKREREEKEKKQREEEEAGADTLSPEDVAALQEEDEQDERDASAAEAADEEESEQQQQQDGSGGVEGSNEEEEGDGDGPAAQDGAAARRRRRRRWWR